MDTTPRTTRGKTVKIAALAVLVGAGLVGVVFLQLSAPDYKSVRTQATLREVRWAVDEYIRVQGTPPDRLAVLVPDYLAPSEPLKDGWHRDFVHSPAASAGHPFLLSSNGRDGRPGTKDDLDAWTTNGRILYGLDERPDGLPGTKNNLSAWTMN